MDEIYFMDIQYTIDKYHIGLEKKCLANDVINEKQ